jgi:geranylgeranyl pyrophosphate synthase
MGQGPLCLLQLHNRRIGICSRSTMHSSTGQSPSFNLPVAAVGVQSGVPEALVAQAPAGEGLSNVPESALVDSTGANLPPQTQGEAYLLQPEIYSLLADVVAIPAMDPGYLESLHRSITSAYNAESTKTPLSLLPLLSCQAAGGEPRFALPAAAAWRALHLAAKLLDDVEDGDAPAIPDAPSGAANSINRATGYFSAAGLALLELDPDVQITVLPSFYRTILSMSSGQHIDLTQGPRTFDDYATLISAKSGRFFALATSSGARCATSNGHKISLLDNFGFNVGIFIQLIDDYLDWQNSDTSNLSAGRDTLPICLIRSVGTEQQRSRLEQLLAHARSSDSDWVRSELHDLASVAGAEAFMLAEMVRHKVRALADLDELDRLCGVAHNSQPLRNWFSAFSAFAPC